MEDLDMAINTEVLKAQEDMEIKLGTKKPATFGTQAATNKASINDAKPAAIMLRAAQLRKRSQEKAALRGEIFSVVGCVLYLATITTREFSQCLPAHIITNFSPIVHS